MAYENKNKLLLEIATLFCVVIIALASITNHPRSGNNGTINAIDNAHPFIKNPSQNRVEDRFHGEFHGGPDKDSTHNGGKICEKDDHHGINLASWRWCEYYEHILFCLLIVFAGIFKLAFHHTPFLSEYLPESCALIIIGIISGSFIYYGVNSTVYPFPKFTYTLFFNYLLPPIVLDSAYSLYDRDFLYNIGSIITFAVVGTLFNVFTVGFSLYFINYISK